jgi:hypothetical protein
MIIIRPLIDVLGKIIKLPKNSYLDRTSLGSGVPSSSNWLRGDSSWQPITPGPINYGLYTQTETGNNVTASTTESSIVGGGLGTLTVPANGFQVGDSFHAIIKGHISSANNQTLRIRVKSGSVLLADTGLITLPQITSKHFKLDIDFTVRALGSAGSSSIVSGGEFTYSKDASNAFEGSNFSVENNTTFNTTISNTLDITVQWGSNNASNSIYSEIFTLSKTY